MMDDPRMTINYWDRLVRSSVRGTRAQQDAVAREALRASLAGEPTCVFHASAVVQGTVDRCQCNQCQPGTRYA